MHTVDTFRNATPEVILLESQATLGKIVSHFTIKITSVVILIFQIKEQRKTDG